MKCCTQAKLALPVGGVPYFHRLSSASCLPLQSLSLKGRVGEDEVGFQVGMGVVQE